MEPVEAPEAPKPKAEPVPSWHTFAMQHVRRVTPHVREATALLPSRRNHEEGKVSTDSYMMQHAKTVRAPQTSTVGPIAYQGGKTAIRADSFLVENARLAAAALGTPVADRLQREGAGVSHVDGSSFLLGHARYYASANAPTSMNIERKAHHSFVGPDSYMMLHRAEQIRIAKATAPTPYKGKAGAVFGTVLTDHVRKLSPIVSRRAVPREVRL